jgi:hypothetical protein
MAAAAVTLQSTYRDPVEIRRSVPRRWMQMIEVENASGTGHCLSPSCSYRVARSTQIDRHLELWRFAARGGGRRNCELARSHDEPR